MGVNAESFEVDVSSGAELWLNGPWNIDGGLQTKVCHAILDHLEEG